MVELGRLLTAMVTPMDERGEVDWAKIAEEVVRRDCLTAKSLAASSEPW